MIAASPALFRADGFSLNLSPSVPAGGSARSQARAPKGPSSSSDPRPWQADKEPRFSIFPVKSAACDYSLPVLNNRPPISCPSQSAVSFAARTVEAARVHPLGDALHLGPRRRRSSLDGRRRFRSWSAAA